MSLDSLPASDICARFRLGNPIDVKTLGGTRNTNYLLTTDKGRWIVRHRYEGYCAHERLAFDHEAAEFLAEHEAPVVPATSDIDGNSYWARDGVVWEVYRFVEGRHLLDGDPGDVIALAKALSQFHRAGSKFPLRCDKIGPRGETDPANILERIDRIAAEDRNTKDVLTSYRAALSSAASALSGEDYASLPHTLVHGDVQPANILMSDNGVAALVDLDWMAWRPRIYDFGWAILCCCARHETPIGEGDIWSLSQSPLLDPETLQGFIDVYGGVTEAEMTALAPQVILTWIHVRIGLALKARPEERLAFLSRRTAAVSGNKSGDDGWISSLINQLEATGTI